MKKSEQTKRGRRINSRRKGKRGELEAAKFCRDVYGWQDARRRCQYSGWSGADDLETGVPGLFCEVKLCNVWKMNDWATTAMEQAGDRVKLFFYRRNRMPWLTIWLHSETGRLMQMLHGRMNCTQAAIHAAATVPWRSQLTFAGQCRTSPYEIFRGASPIVSWFTGSVALTGCFAQDLIWIPHLKGIDLEI